MHRLIGEAFYAPFHFMAFLRERAYETRCRACITMSQGARILSGARVHNLQRDRDAIIIGAHTLVRGELLTFAHGGRITLGDWCFIGEGSRIWSAASVRIGHRVLISHNVNIHDSNSHPIDSKRRHEHFAAIATTGHPTQCEDIDSKPITIEDDVWIGFNSIILKGVTIGAGSIVAAGSVVPHDIPPGSLFMRHETRTIR